MTHTDYRAVLRGKEAELTAGLHNREGLQLEHEPDIFDQIQNASDRALVIQALDRNSVLLQEVRAALQRIADGSFGSCVACDEPIGPKRLSAAPWAARCLRCQELADRQESQPPARAFGRSLAVRSAA